MICLFDALAQQSISLCDLPSRERAINQLMQLGFDKKTLRQTFEGLISLAEQQVFFAAIVCDCLVFKKVANWAWKYVISLYI